MRSHTDSRTVRFAALLVLLCLIPWQSLAQEEDRPQLLLQTAHGSWAVSVAYSPDGKYLASGGWDGTLRLWDSQTRRLLWCLSPGAYRGWSLAFSPDGKWLAAQQLGEPGSVKLWEASSGRLAQTLKGSTSEALSMAFSPDGKLLAAGTGNAEGKQYYDPGRFKTVVQLWDTETGEELRTFTGHTDNIWSVAFAADGKGLVSGSEDGTVRVWDIETGQTLRTLRWHEGIGHDPPYGPRAIAFSPDRKRLATGWFDGTVTLWDMATGGALRRLRAQKSNVPCVAFSPDGLRLASGSQRGEDDVKLWDVRTGDLLKEIDTSDGSWSLSFSHDGRRLATAHSKGAICIWDTAPSGALLTLQPSVSSASAIAFDPEGKRLAAGGGDGNITLWDLQTGQPLQRLGGPVYGNTYVDMVTSVPFSPDGKRLLSGSRDGTVRLWDTETGQAIRVLKLAHSSGGHGVTTLAFSPDGKYFASGGGDNTVKLWDAETGASLQTFQGHTRNRGGLAFSPDGKRLASADNHRDIKLWDIETGDLVKAFEAHTHLVTSLAFSRDGKRLASGECGTGPRVRRGQAGVTEKRVRIWDVATARSLHAFEFERMCWIVAFSPDDKRLTAINRFGNMKAWDAQAGRLLRESKGAIRPRGALALSPDRSCLASGGAGGVGLWNGDDGRLLVRLIAITRPDGGPGGWLVTTPQGYYTGSADAARIITWRVGTEVYPVDAFRDVFYRPDLVEKALRGETLDDERALTNDDIPPAVRILSPGELAYVDAGAVPVSLVAHGFRKVTGLDIYANGRRVNAEVERGIIMGARGIMMTARDMPKQHRVTRGFTGTMPLPPGESRVTLRFGAIDEAGLRSWPAEVTVIQRDARPIQGVLHVLAVGVSDYKNRRHELGLAASDALAVAEVVKKQAGPDRLYSGVKATALVNSAATSSAVRAELEELVDESRPADTVMLFISGHGMRDDHYNYYFATYEVDVGSLQQTALRWSDFQELVRKLQAKQVLVLLDTCHAAGGLGNYAATNQALGEVLADRAGVMVLASSSAAEKSYESEEWGHGAFTTALLEALNGKCGPKLSPGVLEDYVGGRVAELTSGRQHPYVPLRTQFPAGAPLLLASKP